MRTIDIVIPTYGRPEKLERTLRSIPIKEGVNIYVYFDNNDETYYEFKDYPRIIAKQMPHQYKAFGIWNYHLGHLESDAMVYLCDDVELYPDCLDNLLKEFETRFPDTDGVVTFNQANLESCSIYAMGLVGKKFAERYPYNAAFCLDYKSFYADTELGYFAESLDKFYYGENCKITHYHPSVVKSAKDGTHALVRDDEARIDKVVWTARRIDSTLWGETCKLIRKDIN